MRSKGSRARVSREILREPAAGLERFGYRPVQAEFLAAAALLGGYFVRRQYRSFAGCRRGRAEVALLRRAVGHGHATAVVGKALYRLRGASLYRALGPRARGAASRPRARRGVKQRLLALDYFVESSDEGRWLLTATHKAEYFSSLGIPAERFPAAARKRAGKTRAFADGFPMLVQDGGSPTVVLSYAHAGATASAMSKHLERHEALAADLAGMDFGCRWAVLAESPVQFLRLRRAWTQWRGRLERDWSELEYFELRRAVEQRRWDTLTAESVERYATLLAAHQSEGAERRYAAWIESGAPRRSHESCLAGHCAYQEVLLDFDYRAADAVPSRA